MRTSNIILACLVTATAYADYIQTYVFFAKVNGTLKPLDAEENNIHIKYLFWSNFSAKASEFYYKDGRAHSSNASNSGTVVANIFDGFFLHKVHGGSVLKLDKQKRLKNFFFYSCEEYTGFNKIHTVKYFGRCFFSEIYFLPYNRTSNAPMKGSYVDEKDIERIPHVFFIKSKNYSDPLYSETLKPQDLGLIPFHHGNPKIDPVEFFVQEDYAITESGGAMSGYAGFTKEDFGYGIYYHDTKLDLDEKMKLSHQSIFSCRDSRTGDRIIVLNPYSRTGCLKVDVYLLPYNRTSRRPMEGSYEHANDSIFVPDTRSGHPVNASVVDVHKPMPVDRGGKPVSSSSSPDLPHVFFRKNNYDWVPLSTTYSDKKHYTKMFSLSKSKAAPMEFILRNGTAYTNTSTRMYAGSYGKYFGYGPSETQDTFELNGKMKIKNKHFYKCTNAGKSSNLIVSSDKPPIKCMKEVEIYLLPYNRTSGRPLKDPYKTRKGV